MRHAAFLRFTHQRRGGLHTYTVAVPGDEMLEPVWPGLWREQPYPDDPELNPHERYGISNFGAEALAVWRAFAWAVTAGTRRYGIPTFERDVAAALLDVDRTAICLIRWQYQVDVTTADAVAADVGFIPARASVPIRPAPDSWQLDHAALAGLFGLHAFIDLTALERAVCHDNCSEIRSRQMIARCRDGCRSTELKRVGEHLLSLESLIAGAASPQ